MKTLIIMLFACQTFAQINATTQGGLKVILNSDKTWEYVKEEVELDSDCSNYIEETYDKMTGKTMYSTKTIIVSKDEVNGYATRFLKSSSGSIIWSIRFVGCGGCIDEDAKIDILFRSGKKMTIYGNNDFNCDNNLVVYFGGTFGKKKELQALCNNEVETIRIHTTQSFCQEDFTEEDSKEFINGLNCIK
jgi:hypothetical protein